MINGGTLSPMETLAVQCCQEQIEKGFTRLSRGGSGLSFDLSWGCLRWAESRYCECLADRKPILWADTHWRAS